MPGLIKVAEKATYFWRLEHDLEFLESPMTRQAEMLNLDRQTIARWRDELGEERMAELATKNFARQFPVVAGALLKRIKKTGDPAAIELWLARFTGWIKRNALEVSRGDEDLRKVSDLDLAKGILTGLSPEQRAELFAFDPSTAPYPPKEWTETLPVIAPAIEAEVVTPVVTNANEGSALSSKNVEKGVGLSIPQGSQEAGS